MAKHKAKSQRDIKEQMRRLIKMDEEANNSLAITRRQERITKIGHKYIQNLLQSKGNPKITRSVNGNLYTSFNLDPNKKYSYSARTGANG